MIIDFHNHFYPKAYIDSLRSGSSRVDVTIDAEGNPVLHYPGDYNIAVRGHRDIAYRESVLNEHGVDRQVLSLTTPGTHVEEPATAVKLARLVNDGFAAIVRDSKRFIAVATLPLSAIRRHRRRAKCSTASLRSPSPSLTAPRSSAAT